MELMCDGLTAPYICFVHVFIVLSVSSKSDVIYRVNVD